MVDQINRPVSTSKNRYIILGIVITGMFMTVLDANIISIALPTITKYFDTTIGFSQWIAISYFTTVVATLLIFGTLSICMGKSRLFVLGLAIFTSGSLACGLSGSIIQLIIFRILQALGASMMLSVTLAIIVQVFPIYERGKAIGYFTAIIALGMITGPAIGGYIIEALGWAYIFFINVSIGTLLIVPAIKYLKMEEIRAEEMDIDYVGALLFIIVIIMFSIILNEFSYLPVDLLTLIAYFIIFALAFLAFIKRELIAKKPLLDISIFKNRKFSFPLLSMFLYFTATFMLVIIQPFYFQDVMAFKPSQVGLVVLVMPLAMMFSSPISGMIFDNFRPKNYAMMGIMIMGFALLACGYAFASMNFALILAAFVLAGVCRFHLSGPK